MRIDAVNIHAVIPAGGTGSRFGGAVPKQFLPVAGHLVLEWSAAALLAEPAISVVWLALSADLPEAAEAAVTTMLARSPGRLRRLECAGATRALTVAAALDRIAVEVRDDPWILVHDAARPGLPAAALQRLLAALDQEPVGALLAVPVADTLKRAGSDDRVLTTVPRAGLWQAQTPQAFRLALLRRALRAAGAEAGDEAGAVEALGLVPRLVEGDPQNLKLTRPGDGDLITAMLAAREFSCA